MSKEIKFWGSKSVEYLTHTEMDDAIESMLDGIGDINVLPKTIEICSYARMELPKAESLASSVLESLIEDLDNEHGDPTGDHLTEISDTMKEAAKDFVTAVLKEYVSWACELVKCETVNVQEWIKENRPDWLEEEQNNG